MLGTYQYKYDYRNSMAQDLFNSFSSHVESITLSVARCYQARFCPAGIYAHAPLTFSIFLIVILFVALTQE